MFGSQWFTTQKVCLALLLWKKIEQRVCLELCSQWNCDYGINENVAEFFGESTLSSSQVFEWHKAFSEGREVVENLPRASRPSISFNDDNIEKVKKIGLENRRVCIREVAEAADLMDRLNTLWFMFRL